MCQRKNTSVRRALFHKCLFRRTTPFLDRRHINMYHVSPVYLYFTFFSSKTFRASPHLQLHLNSANVFVFNWQFYKVSETCFLQGPNSVARHNVVCSSFVKDCSSDWMFWRKFNFQSLKILMKRNFMNKGKITVSNYAHQTTAGPVIHWHCTFISWASNSPEYENITGWPSHLPDLRL